MHDPHDLQQAVARFARDVAAGGDEQGAAETVTAEIAKHFDAVDGAGITLAAGRSSARTIAATETFVEAADRFQEELGEGPCMDSLRHERQVHAPDLRHDDRWPRWAEPVVSELGVGSVLAVQLFVHGDHLGALNLYSLRTDAFDDDDVEVASFFAAHAAVAISSMRTIDQLRHGMARRTLIGQAEGVLMERYALTGQQAFALLRRVSQEKNLKLYDVAETVVATRDLPGAPARS